MILMLSMLASACSSGNNRKSKDCRGAASKSGNQKQENAAAIRYNRNDFSTTGETRTMQSQQQQQKPRPRLDYLDNLRTALTVLVIVFHASIAYGAAGSWILEDADKSELTVTNILLTIFTAVNQAYFMGLFFFLSSYFMPASYDRKGPARFLADRLVRLGIPLIVYYFAIGPMTSWYAHDRGEMTLAGFYREHVWSFERTFFGPAWFLEASIYFTVLYVIWRLLRGKRESQEGRRLPFPGGTALTAAALLLGLTAFAVRFAYPVGEGPLELQLGYFPSYILLFIAGAMAYRHGWLHGIPERTAQVWKWIGIGAIPVLPIALIATGALEGDLTFAGGASLQAFLYAMWEPFVCIGIVIALLEWFRSRFNSAGRFRKWLSANAYAVYLIHPPVVVGWTIAFTGLPLHPAAKWIVVSALSAAVCFAAAAAIRAIPGVKRVI